jgi:DNA-binding NtrC family response regulator
MEETGQGIKSPDTGILIVDDNPQYSFVLAKMLRAGFGYHNITTAASVEEGYKLISEQPGRFRLLFIDYQFPSGASGGELLRKLNIHNLLSGKIAFLITSDPTVDNVGEAMAAGALGVVAKPFDREALRVQLDKAQRAVIAASAESF